jgi:hypothetical protein
MAVNDVDPGNLDQPVSKRSLGRKNLIVAVRTPMEREENKITGSPVAANPLRDRFDRGFSLAGRRSSPPVACRWLPKRRERR